MKIKNPKLMIACSIGGAFLFTGFIYSIMHTTSSSQTNPQSNTGNAIASYDYQSGDTNTEVLNTVVANQKSLEASNKALAAKNEQLEQQLQQGQATQIDSIKGTLADQLASIKNSLQAQIDGQHNALNSGSPSNPNAGYAINGAGNNNSVSTGQSGVIGTVEDISSAFTAPASPQSNSVAAVYAAANGGSQQQNAAPSLPSDSQPQNQPQLMYSIPDGATIGSVYMMTATLAEVPVSGRLIAPAWPFKAIIGRQDLMGTNSQMLPSQIAGAIIQGHAVGNMGLGCANLYVDKITYTFNDGHFWVYPSDANDQSSSDGTQVYPSHSLGYLALPDGTQCITGLYLTDAPKVLLNLTLLGAANNAGNVMANQQISTVSNALTGQTGTNITGSAGKLFGWSALSGGSDAALTYYQQRVADVFDAIFLPSSTNHQPTKLIFNVQETIPIDYDPNSVMDASKTSLSGGNNNLD